MNSSVWPWLQKQQKTVKKKREISDGEGQHNPPRARCSEKRKLRGTKWSGSADIRIHSHLIDFFFLSVQSRSVISSHGLQGNVSFYNPSAHYWDLLTFIIKWEHVELESAGLHADVTVNMLRSRLMNCDGVLQGLHTGLQAERLLGITYWVPGGEKTQALTLMGQRIRKKWVSVNTTEPIYPFHFNVTVCINTWQWQ